MGALALAPLEPTLAIPLFAVTRTNADKDSNEDSSHRYGKGNVSMHQRNAMNMIVVVLACLLVMLGAPAGAQEEPQTREEMIRLLEQWAETQVGDIDIQGTVVSDDGRPLMGVRVDFYFRELGDVVARKKVVREELVADGEFRIMREGISAVHLTFHKEGYYSERWSYLFNEETPRSNPGGFETVTVEISLEQKPEMAPLEKYSGILRFDLRGPTTGLEVERKSSRAASLWKDGERIEIERQHVVLDGPETGSSELAVAQFKDEDQGRLRDGLERGWIRFNTAEPGDGFVVYELASKPLRPEQGFREMRLAPERGYQPRLELTATESPPKVYFFCRINGRFGKGMVTGRPIIVVEDEHQEARAGVVLYMNPTGSRDVSYVHR